jgi:hypothetical protein
MRTIAATVFPYHSQSLEKSVYWLELAVPTLPPKTSLARMRQSELNFSPEVGADRGMIYIVKRKIGLPTTASIGLDFDVCLDVLHLM